MTAKVTLGSSGEVRENYKPEWRLGEHGVPVARYTDRDFASLEAEKFWPHVWQMACRLDQVRNPGDYFVYEIVDQSIIVVRVDEATIKAFHNVCPHRATALAVGSGRFQLDTIVCPFHGWKWNLNGESTFVLDRSEFMGGCLTDDYLHLHECQVAIWMGGIWINMDTEAPPLEQQMGPIKDLVDPLLLDHMKFDWHKSLVVNANWKVAQEAFFEAYHVTQTHPQLLNPKLGGTGLPRYNYMAFDNGHGMYHTVGAPALMGVNQEMASVLSQDDQVDTLVRSLTNFYDGLESMVLEEDIAIAKSMRHRDLEGESVLDAFHRVLREYYSAQGRPIPTREALARVTNMFVFPNVTFLPTFGNLLLYRSRPTRDNAPDWCIFELFSLKTYPADEQPPAWRTEECTDPKDPKQYRLIPRQDFSNIPRQQRGMNSKAIKATALSDPQEILIKNMHAELDNYLMV
jgi:phenylpropionate dioxygenase-like ring-hydroxylating dioxygenase large terminal subunit